MGQSNHKKTKQLSIENTHIVTIVPGKRTPGENQAPAIINATTEVSNIAGKDSIICELQCEMDGIKVSLNLKVPPKTKETVKFPELTLEHPKLWWPNGYGPQDLYPLNVRCLIN